MKESMYKAGVVANPNGMDFNLFYKNAANHKFDAMLGGWGSSAAYSNPMQLWHYVIMGKQKGQISVDLEIQKVMH